MKQHVVVICLRGMLLVLAGMCTVSCSYTFYRTRCHLPVPGRFQKQGHLEGALNESSGLLYMGGDFWSFNDSGGKPELYRLDGRTGKFKATCHIDGASNVDWEDITCDGEFVYVADVGNNFHGRDTLVIYRVPAGPVLAGNDSVAHAGRIRFYFDKTPERTIRGMSSLDCEAVIAAGDSLYLFTKDWVRESTVIYTVPVLPGCSPATRRGSYDIGMLVTGADAHTENRRVVLIGYHDFMPVVTLFSYDVSPAAISCGGRARFYPLETGRQVEGICFDADGQIFVSSEKTLRRPSLFKVDPSWR